MPKCENPNGSPMESPACQQQDLRAASEVSASENILVRTLANAPPNDALLHGRVDRAILCATCAHATLEQSVSWSGHLGTPVTWYYCDCPDCIAGDHYERGRS